MSFWSQLAQERELRGVSLQEVAERTKISRATLELMEAGDPDHLPARVYLLGYLRSYAEAVGLDAADVVLRYEEQALRCGENGESTSDDESCEPNKKKLPPLLWVAIGVLLTAGAALVLLLSGS